MSTITEFFLLRKPESAISGMRTKSLYTGFGKHGASTQKLWVKQPDYWSGHEVYSSKNQISTN